MNSRFPHNRLVAWTVALEAAAEAQVLADSLPRGYAPLADQMRRAAMSIGLNLAEGASRRTAKDKSHRFVIARGECGELAAATEIAIAMKALPADGGARLVGLADRAASMLTGLIKQLS